MATASGFTSITEFSLGPPRSTAAIRSRYAAVSARDVNSPALIFFWSSSIVASANGNAARTVAAMLRTTVTTRNDFILNSGKRGDELGAATEENKAETAAPSRAADVGRTLMHPGSIRSAPIILRPAGLPSARRFQDGWSFARGCPHQIGYARAGKS